MSAPPKKGTDTTKKKLTSILPSKQQSAVEAPAAGAGIPAKRIREVHGTKEEEDEPLSKKKRLEVAAKSSAVKPTAPLSDEKNKGSSKAKSLTSAKETPSKDNTADKDTKKSTKVKLQSSVAKSDASRPSKSNTSEKTAKPSRQWLPDEEFALSKEIQKDGAHDAYGAQLPSARADPYWEKLMSRLSFMEKYENGYRGERLCEKVRRMRVRYDSLLTRMKAGETNVWKSDHEGKLWRIWHTIWGPLKATPDMLNGDGDEEKGDEAEEDEESEEEDEEDESLSGTAPEVEVEVASMSEMMASMKASIQKDLQKDIDAMKADLKKLKPVHKQFVRDRGLSLINEFIAFISQIHGTGVQWKYVKGYNTGKFNKLVGNVDFEADCQEFLSSDQVDPSPSLKSTSDLCALFNNLCNTRNSMMHYEEPEDCILEVQKFERKHGDLLHKCSEEVQFCVPRIRAMARHFVGPYRLKRLACQCIGRFLASHGLSWKNLTELEKVLDGNPKLINQSKPQGTRSKSYKSQIMTLFASSIVNGPKWTGASKDEGEDYPRIQAAFVKCARLDMLPPRASYALEYGILEHAWA